MGKKQHSKDQMYLTATEWKGIGGKRETSTNRAYRPLPFDSCALSLQPFETPVCTPEGVLFDILNLFPYVQKHKKSPITGEAMTAKDIIRLTMHKNQEGKWHCPVTFKEFTDHSKVVAVKPSGNVYAWDAVQELNVKRKNWTDLMTGEPFTRKDIITLQDPSDTAHMALRDISNFKHLEEMRAEEAAKQAAASEKDKVGNTIRTNASTEMVIKEFQRQKREREEEEALKAAAAEAKAVEEEAAAAAAAPDGKRPRRAKILIEDLHPGKKVTTGAAAASFTATGMDLRTGNQCREATEEEVKEVRWKFARKLGKKGYVQLQTSLGNLNIEVHCDFVPRTAENFLGLCLKGSYDGLAFHRCIKGFMIQGGCPKGDGTGGSTIWGDTPFKDEFDSRLLHDKRGVLSMANSGRDTNRSQFFITFKACRHLDNQHTVFGRVVGGLETLARMEAAEVDKDDRPVAPLKILKAVAFVNPLEESDKQFEDFIAQRQAEREADERFKKDNNALGFSRPAPAAKRSAAEEEEAQRTGGFYSNPGPAAKSDSASSASASASGKQPAGGGVGKYIGGSGHVTTLPKLPAGGVGVGPVPHPKESAALQEQAVEGKKKPALGAKPAFKNFDNW